MSIGRRLKAAALMMKRRRLERRQLAWAMFESIPYEHRLGSHIYGGRTWGGERTTKIQDAVGTRRSFPMPNTDAYAGDSGGAVGCHYADMS